jgi:formate hydrogenlyase subunit 3/multisubunit Na+/H+ antiporter MnhD subunit
MYSFISGALFFLGVALATPASAAIFGGPGLQGGINEARNIDGLSQKDPWQIGQEVLLIAISFVSLLAIIALVVAGIMLILDMGNDQAKDRAKKTVIYTIIALILLLFSRVLVTFVSTITT